MVVQTLPGPPFNMVQPLFLLVLPVAQLTRPPLFGHLDQMIK